MSRAHSTRRYTPAEYYELERTATYKSDYYKGEIFAMSGGTARHSLISNNISGETRQRLKGKPCRAYESNLRIKVTPTGLRTYPDASVVCGPLELDEEDPNGETCTNPTVLFEVLSPSTELSDRNVKARSYPQIESLRAFALVRQDEPHVELYTRNQDGTWRFQWYDGLSASIPLPMLQIDLPLSEIYAGVDFSDPDTAAR
jgi:Uma2 family endonuclease